MAVMKVRPLSCAAVLAAVALAGCALPGSSADDALGRFAVAPGKYALYSCEELAAAMNTTAARERELLGLMQKAGSGADGQLVSAIAYQPDYIEVHGELGELQRAALSKRCAVVTQISAESSKALR
jgi:hypothetical protein